MENYTLLLLFITTFSHTTFSQEKEAIKNRFYISVPNHKTEIVNKVKENITDLKSVYQLKNSDIIIFETKNAKQRSRLSSFLKGLNIELKQDYKLPFSTCTTPAFVANDLWTNMGYWNSLASSLWTEKQNIDSIFYLLKSSLWNSQDDIGENVRIALSEIPNGTHLDWPEMQTTYSYDYLRNSTIDYANKTIHGSGTAGALAIINNATTSYNGGLAGISNVNIPIIKNVGDANNGYKSAQLAAMQSCINETNLTGEKRILSLSFLLTTGTDTDFDAIFNQADANGKVLFVIAAGNNNLPIGATYSTKHFSTLIIQASDGKGVKASFSSYNAPLSFNGVSTRGLNVTDNTTIDPFNGTSAAAPNAAAAAHLLWSLMPAKTAGEIRAMLVDSLNTTTFITNPSNTRTPALRIGYLIQNLHFDIVHDYRDSVSVSSNGGVANLYNSVHDIQGGTIANPTFWYQKNQTGSWVQLPNGLLNKADLGAGNHFVKLEFDILHQPSKCTQIIRPIKLFSSNAYTFIGNGNWSIASNWLNGLMPPTNLTNAGEIIINPTPNGECILDVTQSISQNSKLTIVTGKKFRIIGDLLIQ